ncbi:uncharacterized protein LOC106669588 isoform X2 [Cimex lectularius]|nr:uncharacterized protein LOC106669588 isoform X2 [Cimex lectularius]
MNVQRDFYMKALTNIGYAINTSWDLEQVEKLLFKCSTKRKTILKKVACAIENKDRDDYTDEELLRVINSIVHIPKNLDKSFIEGVTTKSIQKKLWSSIFHELKHLSFVEPAKQISVEKYFYFLNKLVIEKKFPYDTAVEMFGVQEECNETEGPNVTADLIAELDKTIMETKAKMKISHTDEIVEVPTFEKIDCLVKPLADFNKRCKEKEIKCDENVITEVTCKLENITDSFKTISDIKSLQGEENFLKYGVLCN